MTPVEICRTLLTGFVSADNLPELQDEDVRAEVADRLASAGCALRYSPTHRTWLALTAAPLPDAAVVDAPDTLNAKDQAVLAMCWLYLRYLPQENSGGSWDDDALFAADAEALATPLSVEEIIDQLTALSHTAIGISVGKLKNLRYLVQRDGKLSAGPTMDTIDAIAAAEACRRLLLRHERIRRASTAPSPNAGTTEPGVSVAAD